MSEKSQEYQEVEEAFDNDKALTYIEDYVETYRTQVGWESYQMNTWIEDILYGLGVSINPDKFKFAKGMREFKIFLKEYLENNP